MLKDFLNMVSDPEDYIAVLTIFRKDETLTDEEVRRLVQLYEKYLPWAADVDYVRCCLAVHLVPGRSRANWTDFDSLGMLDGELEAVFTAVSIAQGDGMSMDLAQDVATLVSDKALSVPARVLLARIALDEMADSPHFVEMRPQIAVLAEFLTECGAEVLEHCTSLVREVKMKCRK